MTSRELYEHVIRTVDTWPARAHTAIELLAEGGLVLLALLLAAAAVRRRRDPRTLVTAALGFAATAIAYATSGLPKVAETQPRPCRALPDLETIAACPPATDWSLPSNHAVIAGALAIAVIATAPRLAPLAVIVALAVGTSRVALGVHYPHDVVTGVTLGAAIVALLLLATRRAVPTFSRHIDRAGAEMSGAKPVA